MIAVLIGLVFIVFGAWGFVHWAGDFLVVLRGFGPISIFIGGMISLFSGIASMRSQRPDDNHKE